MTQQPANSLDDITLPALLRHARYTYGAAMRAGLAEAGYDDIPANGLYVIGALAWGGAPLGQIIRELRVSKQAAGQLVDALVLRGYLERQADPEDRRKLTVTLTERGRAAADTQTAAREGVDSRLLAIVGEDNVHRAKQVLTALIDIGRDEAAG
jgi:DNA-binding MarR family transcriptional regulator